ncbi:outer membrane beta-barrel protein [Alteromonas mediterranea]|uniref:outer membrane beta-barrel protein n=1 Tax=Alteromonas mediterranea TaxID=314275 RepID=UPI002FE346B2
MFKKAILSAALLSVSLSASANWVLGVGYGNISDSDGDIDISLGGVIASAGYQYQVNSNFNLVPEVRLGTGISDDDVMGVNVELDSFYAMSIRGEYTVAEGMYIYVVPSYGKLEVTASAGGFSESAESDWEFGLGGGVGYKFTQTNAVELSFETFDDVDVLSIGAKFAF